MIRMQVSEAARVLDAPWTGTDARFQGCGTDTRSLAPGELFVALQGPNFDGHDFLDQAGARGAAAVMVRGDVEVALPALRVSDTRGALGALSAAWRERHAIPLVAVTGSNGKTTVKEMLAAVLGRAGRVLATRGNLNNDIGVPLTLLRLDAEHRYAVVEMGANHPGEIALLTAMARPTVGVVTVCAPAHLEGFGSLEGVARAKGELFEHLPSDGVAVVNADDRFADLWRGLAGTRRVLTFGLGPGAEVTAEVEPATDGSRLHLRTPWGDRSLVLPLPGRHNVSNALAAAAAALSAGVSLDAVVEGVQATEPVAGRLRLLGGPVESTIIDDTYNANPASLEAALDVLAGRPEPRLLALGDMGELGPGAGEYHRAAGEAARRAGVVGLYALGDLSRNAVEAFGEGGRHFAAHADLATALRQALTPGATVLVKGSRAMRMERVVRALTGED